MLHAGELIDPVHQKSAELPQPKKLSEIIARAFTLLPAIFKVFWVWFLLLSLLAVFEFSASAKGSFLPSTGLLSLFKLVIQLLLDFFLYLAVMLAAGKLWLNKPITSLTALQQTTPLLMLRVAALFIWVSTLTFLGCLLLFIPGVIYGTNRILSGYAAVVDGDTIEEAMATSKALMTQEPWYALKGPYMRISVLLLPLTLFELLGFLASYSPAYYLLGFRGASLTMLELFGTISAKALSALTILCFAGFYYDLRARAAVGAAKTPIQGSRP